MKKQRNKFATLYYTVALLIILSLVFTYNLLQITAMIKIHILSASVLPLVFSAFACFAVYMYTKLCKTSYIALVFSAFIGFCMIVAMLLLFWDINEKYSILMPETSGFEQTLYGVGFIFTFFIKILFNGTYNINYFIPALEYVLPALLMLFGLFLIYKCIVYIKIKRRNSREDS